ncbi:MAG TPA: efflux RND transporter permease subunit [Gammaproteobacteria bacterium]|nr:efflux RND transporter permease subunit [Gammaproteobacteria bacterium]
MNFQAFLQRHRRSLVFLAAALVIGGIFAAVKLPVAMLPDVQSPRILVLLDAGDRPASQMELQVTRPVEIAVRSIPGVKSVRSITSRGSAQISVNYAWGQNMYQALLEVEAKISLMLPDLPADTRFTVERRDPTEFPVIAYSLTSNTVSLVELRDLGLYQLRPLLSRVSGVARVEVQGGHEAEYHVDVNPAKLRALHLSLADVVNVVSAGNVLTAVGRFEDHYKLYLLVSDTRLQDINKLKQVVLRRGANGIVTVGDVAQVSLSTVPQWIRITANGTNAVLLNIFQQPGANTVQIDQGVEQLLQTYKQKLPPDVHISKWYDQSGLIVASTHSVRDAILIGVILAALVLFIFLRNYKITIISILIVPSAIAISILLLYVLGLSFNIMTLGGIAAAVGLVIDDVVVMCEHIVRRLREKREQPPHERIMWAAREFTRPLMGSSASTIIIFIPLAFLGGITGAFFKSLSLTMASTLVFSFLLAWLVVPVLAGWWLRDKDGQPEHFGWLARHAHRFYFWLIPHLLRRPVWLLAGLIPLAALGILGYHYVGTGFLPRMDQGGFTFDYIAPPGTSLTETDRMLRQVEHILQTNPNVESYSRRTGTQLGGGVTEANSGDIFVNLKPFPREPIEKVMSEVRDAVNAQVPGLRIDLSQLLEDMIGDMTSVPQPVEIKLFSDNTDEILQLAPRVADAISKVPGIVDVNDGVVDAGDALDIHINLVKAGLLGLDPAGITQQLDTYLQGTVAAQVQQGVKFVGIRVWTPPTLRLRTGQLGEIPIRAPDGKVFPLSEVATVTTVTGQPEIDRDNLKRLFAVTARISGRSLGTTISDVKKVLATPGLIPKGVDVQLGGLYKQQQIAFRGLAIVFAAAVALIFALLLFLYEGFRVVLSIMTAPLMAVGMVFFALWIVGIELNITAIMGMTMIVGIVTEVAIFYFSEFMELKHAENFEKALVDAGLNRMRAIALTTLTTILALLPLALDIGQGAAMQQPLAVAIIAGEAIQLPLVLIVMPVIYYLLMGGRRRLPGAPPGQQGSMEMT